ncbi:hypothetical protein T4D_7717 [Trichinella pseudospiralis]|uniref:Uncharacterized protein n=1 Tax=Trichinella pseudospiralis TaxID=6337 RepID=A0A0V1FLS1_TRIPS|nr:hypothetical protein T4D_7717 [Trichinella pseudospiralis]
MLGKKIEDDEEEIEKKKLTRFGTTSKDESENRCTTIHLDGKLLDITIHIHSSVINEKVPFATSGTKYATRRGAPVLTGQNAVTNGCCSSLIVAIATTTATTTTTTTTTTTLVTVISCDWSSMDVFNI